MCGSISIDTVPDDAVLSISITDVTDTQVGPRPILCKTDQVNFHDPAHFSYRADIGTLRQKTTTLANWTTVATLPATELLLPRTGRRLLQFDIAVLSRRTGRQFAAGQCTCVYHNSELGYLDHEQKIQRAKTLAVGLAFAASAIDGKLFASEIDLIKNWAQENIEPSNPCDQIRVKIEKSLDRTVTFFRSGGQIDVSKVCTEISAIAPLAQRYEILELCLRVVQTKGYAAPEELTLLKDIAAWLNTDSEKFRAMTERILPITMHKTKDTEAVLGITTDMTKEQTRQQLNKEYAKWGSRVTSCDPAVRSQAEQMLRLLADARRQCMEIACPN
jgi:hypothetical protein